MLKHLTRQFGLLILGLCILASCATLAGSMHSIKSATAELAGQVKAESLCREVIASALDLSAIAPVKRQEVSFNLPGRNPFHN